MARFNFFAFLLVFVSLAHAQQVSEVPVPQANSVLVGIYAGPNEDFAMMTDANPSLIQRLYRRSVGANQPWTEVLLPAGKKFFVDRPSGWSPMDFNRISSDGTLYLRANDSLAGFEGVYTVRYGQVQPLINRFTPIFVEDSDGGKYITVTYVTVVNPGPLGSFTTRVLGYYGGKALFDGTVQFVDGRFKLVHEMDSRIVPTLDGGIWSDNRGFVGVAYSDFNKIGRLARFGRVDVSAGLVETYDPSSLNSIHTVHDPASGERFVISSSDGSRTVSEFPADGNGLKPFLTLPSTGDVLFGTMSRSQIVYGIRANPDASLSAIVLTGGHLEVGQNLPSGRILRRLQPAVALTPAAVYGSRALVPFYAQDGKLDGFVQFISQ